MRFRCAKQTSQKLSQGRQRSNSVIRSWQGKCFEPESWSEISMLRS